MSNKLKFAVEDIRLLEDDSIDTSQFSLLEVDAFATGKSLHDTFVTEETLRKTAKSILLKPFVFGIDKNFDDLSTHVPDEIPGGFVPHNSKLEFKQLPDGRLMLSVDVLIWRRYSGKLLEYFQRDENKKGVSVEIEVFETRDDPVSGLMEIVNFCYNAITGLGDMIQSAIPNAEAVMVFSKEFEKAKEEYEFSISDRYGEIDFTIPKAIRNNAKKSLYTIKEKGGKSNSVHLATARFLASNEKITPDRLKQIHKFMNRKTEFDDLTLGLYGGKQSLKWSNDLMGQMSLIDDKQMSYYSDDTQDKSNAVSNNETDDKMGLNKPEENFSSEEENTQKEVTSNMADKVKDEEKETPEEEKKETPEEEKQEEKDKTEKKFSYAEIFGTPEAFANMFADDESDDEDAKAKFASAKEEFDAGANPATMMHAMYAKMCNMSKKMEKMAEDSKVYMAENEDLKKFKADVESQQKEFAVSSTLKELSEKVVIPEDALIEMKAEAEKYSFAEIDGWKNYAKAKSFDFKDKKGKKDEDDEVIKYAFPFANIKVKDSDDVWATLNQ